MQRSYRVLRLFILACIAFGIAGTAALAAPATDAQRPELAYLKQVNLWRPPDPQLLFLLMAQFANAGRHVEGIDFFNAALKRFDAQLDNPHRGLYLLAIASLRAGHANDVALFNRAGWVRDTVKMLDDAKRLTGGQVFVAHWMSGVVRSQLPAFFGERDNALLDLAWCETNAAKAPHPGWMREVYFALARVHRARGDDARAQQYQRLSGFAADRKPGIFTTPFEEDPAGGHTFSARAVREVVPGSVFALSGFGFTEFYFVISADRRELIAIDAGARPDSARAALEALKAAVPSLPLLTTVFITHAHWDHVGGHSYFRSLGSARFISRSNYKDELARDATGDPATGRQFFGSRFDLADVLSFHADATIDRPTELVIGGTRFELLPTRGGETDDAMLVHMPEQGIVFAGDILMPYIGAPFVAEGSVDGMLAAIEQLHALKPRVLLHGHEPLTRMFTSTAMLDDLHEQIAWLRGEVLRAISRGADRASIQAANLIPPTLERSGSDVHLAYLVMRENVINRLFEQNSGYWQNGMQGLDALGDADRGEVLVDYLGISEAQAASAIERMIADGKHELAAETVRWVESRFGASARLRADRELAYVKLMEKYQEFNPFKFIVYAGQINPATAPGSESAQAAAGSAVH